VGEVTGERRGFGAVADVRAARIVAGIDQPITVVVAPVGALRRRRLRARYRGARADDPDGKNDGEKSETPDTPSLEDDPVARDRPGGALTSDD
jgi:hypothetical protein